MPASALRAPACSVVLALPFLLVVLASTSAQAEGGREVLRIEWPSIPGCPPRSTVAALAARAVAGVKEADRVLARVDIKPPATGDPWRVHIRTRTIRGAGERILEAKTCDELARATALLVALTALRTAERPLEADVEELRPQADRYEDPPLFGEPPARIGSPNPEKPDAEMNDEGTFVASVGVFADSGALPRLAVGPSLRFEWGLAAYRVRANVVLSLEQEQVERGLGARFGLFGASLDLCRVAPLRPIRPQVCLGAEVDQLNATGIGDQRFEAQRTTGFAFGALGAEWLPARSVRVGIDVRMGPSLRRPSFVVERASGERIELHQQSAVRGQVLITFGMEF